MSGVRFTRDDERVLYHAGFKEYVQHNCCGARALRALGVKGSVQSLSTQAAQLLKKLEVQQARNALRKKMEMSALEVVARMSDMARADLGDFLDRQGRVDLAKARRLGKLHLIRDYRVEVEERDGSEKRGPKVRVLSST